MVVGTLRGIGEEFVGLLGRTAATWWRLARWLLALCLLGWVGYYGAVLLGTELAFRWPWLVILGLAFGTVTQLAAIVVALRFVMSRSGVSFDTVAPVEAHPPAEPIRLVAQTILPFLAIYAAFGFVDDYARDVVLAMAGRYGAFGSMEFLGSLNPTRSPETLAVVLSAVVVLYLARRVLDRLAERSDRIWIGLIGAYLEAAGLLLVLLSAFRLVEQAKLWLNDRQVAAWWDVVSDTLFGWIHLEGFWLSAWDFLARNAWPALWSVLTQPLAWLALTAVVAGIKVGTSAELLEQVRGEQGARLGRVANGFFTGDLDDKFMPLWHAVRFLARAGLPLLGGYVLAFTAVNWIGELAQTGLDQFVGPQYDDGALLAMPFYDLVPKVIVLGLRLALLGVTVARASELMAGGRAAQRPRVGEVATVLLVCFALALSSLALDNGNKPTDVHGRVGVPLAIFGARVTVGEPRAGRELVDKTGTLSPTDLVFVVVPLSVFDHDGTSRTSVGLRAGERTYQPWSGTSAVLTEAGFASANDIVFEVDPADLADELDLELRPGGSLYLGGLRGHVPLRVPAVQPQVDYVGIPELSVP